MFKNPFAKKRPVYPEILRKDFKTFSIELPSEHPLLGYQKDHPKYDTFLPYLALHSKPSETILDIGANVGDTLAAMAEVNPTTKYVCIEADELFFRYLLKNTEKITSSLPGLEVQNIQAFVGGKINNVSLEGGKGTKRADLNKPGAVQAISLDQLAKEKGFPIVSILKTDTDGFDYDVLESSMRTIERDKPMLYFECQIDHEYQKKGYLEIFKKLEKLGYCDWTFFDNFGDIIIRTNSGQIIRQMVDYVWCKTAEKAHKTIYYYDILTTQKNKATMVDQTLRQYRSSVLFSGAHGNCN